MKKLQFGLLIVGLAAQVLSSGCQNQDEEKDKNEEEAAPEGVAFYFSLEENFGFYEAPFPTELRRGEDGFIRLDDFPNPYVDPNSSDNKEVPSPFIDLYLGAGIEAFDGFGTNSGVYFHFDGGLDPASLPQTITDTIDLNASAYLVNIDPDSPDYGLYVPVHIGYLEQKEKFTPADLLAMVPVQGYVLRPLTLYAAVVSTRVTDNKGNAIIAPRDFARIKKGVAPEAPLGARALEVYQPLFDYAADVGLDLKEIAAATVYRTRDPIKEMQSLYQSVMDLPTPEYSSIESADEWSYFRGCANCCVIEGRLDVPKWQQGERPYLSTGGKIEFDMGVPVQDGWEPIPWVIAFPLDVPMPEGGFPVYHHMHGSGGSRYSGLYHSADLLITPERGFGYGGIDAPFHGGRTVIVNGEEINDDSGILFYNFLNPYAFRDNIRQAAADYIYFHRFLRSAKFDSSNCPGVDTGGRSSFYFDPDNLYVISHSQGSTMSPIVGALDPDIKGMVLSGAGSSMILVMLTKTLPANISNLVRIALGQLTDELTIFSPVLNILQALGESADGLNFARHLIHEPLPGNKPKAIYHAVGIVDHYVDPSQQHALAASIGLDLIGDIVDDDILMRTSLTGGEIIVYPASGNIVSEDGTKTTGVAHQFPVPPDRTFDGHFVTSNLSEPRHEYGCMLKTLVDSGGTKSAIPMGGADQLGPCPAP